eukprot:g30573.t1
MPKGQRQPANEAVGVARPQQIALHATHPLALTDTTRTGHLPRETASIMAARQWSDGMGEGVVYGLGMGRYVHQAQGIGSVQHQHLPHTQQTRHDTQTIAPKLN